MATQETITIPIERFFEKLEAKLDRIDEKLDTKADRSVVDDLARRTVALESRSASADSVERYKRWLIALAFTVAGLVISMAAVILRSAGL